ncbi:hypothetical protein D9M72_448690 [compost metagenome]
MAASLAASPASTVLETCSRMRRNWASSSTGESGAVSAPAASLDDGDGAGLVAAWAATPVPATMVAARAAMATPARVGLKVAVPGRLSTGDSAGEGASGAGVPAGRAARARRISLSFRDSPASSPPTPAGLPPLGLITSSARPASIRRPPSTINGTAHGVDVSLGNVMEMDDGAGLVPSEANSSDHSPSAGALQV